MIIRIFNTLGAVLHDFAYLFIESRFSRINQLKNYDYQTKQTIHILGNGKSLLDNGGFAEEVDYMVVNRHVLSDDYVLRKPKFYVLADPHFFLHPEGLSVLQQIIEKTTWNIFLFLPCSKTNKEIVNNVIEQNNKISCILYNGSLTETGIPIVDNWLYRHNLAMPRVQNVLVAAIYISIFSGAQTIKLYGVEHSWTKYLLVNNKNEVCLYNPHFYDKGKIETKTVNEIQHKQDFWKEESITIGKLLHSYAYMFDSYHILKKLSNVEGVKILNMTEESFIDAFEREI